MIVWKIIWTWTIGRIYNFMHHCDCEFHDAIVYMYKDL